MTTTATMQKPGLANAPSAPSQTLCSAPLAAPNPFPTYQGQFTPGPHWLTVCEQSPRCHPSCCETPISDVPGMYWWWEDKRTQPGQAWCPVCPAPTPCGDTSEPRGLCLRSWAEGGRVGGERNSLFLRPSHRQDNLLDTLIHSLTHSTEHLLCTEHSNRREVINNK